MADTATSPADGGTPTPKIHFQDETVTLWHGDSLAVLRELESGSVDCCVTSPPYFGLRDYDEPGQYGLEASPVEYVETMRAVFAEVRRVLAEDGTMWLNIGDSHQSAGGTTGVGPNAVVGSTKRQEFGRTRPASGLPNGNLMGIPWRVAFALQDDGWILRSDIIWHKTSGTPESVKSRPTRCHEHVFLLAKSPTYYYDAQAIAEESAGGAKGSRFDVGKTAEHQLGRAQSGERDERPQLRRALALASEKGLTEAHFDAIRAVGMSDAGKAKEVQGGAGKNSVESQRLADEAKVALGGYYREFLTAGTKNARDVWSIPTQPFGEAHFAVMPSALAERAIQAGCKPGGTVLDPFSGSGTTGLAAAKHGRKYVGIDLNAEYLDLSLRTRLGQTALLDGGAA